MPVELKTGDMFRSGAQTLVNTVNTVGIMGKGIALEFRRRFPDMHADYVERCARGEVVIGRPYLFKRETPPWIVNFPTKRHWRDVSRISDIEAGLDYLEQHYHAWGITSLAVPPLGSGNGQLDWAIVGPTLKRHLRRFDVPVILFAPLGTPQAELSEQFLARSADAGMGWRGLPWMDPAWVALAQIVRRIDGQAFHWPVGRTRFQKLAYFATDRGLPTGLAFRRGSFGPYSAELKSVTAKLVNNGVLKEERGERMFHVRPGRTFADAADHYRSQLEGWEPIVGDVTDLFQRMDTRGTEVAASALLVARELAGRGHPFSERDVVDEVLRWKIRRRPPLDESQVAQATRDLNLLGWIGAEVSDGLPLPDGT